MDGSLPREPGGWGFAPGTPLLPPTAKDLPAIDVPVSATKASRMAAVVTALREMPGLHHVTARMVREAYGLDRNAAYEAIRRARKP